MVRIGQFPVTFLCFLGLSFIVRSIVCLVYANTNAANTLQYICPVPRAAAYDCLSYADTHPMFSGDKYPNFFRVVPSEIDFNIPRVQILRAFNWTLVGTLYQNDPRYALAHNKLLNDLDAMEIQIAETQSVTDQLSLQISKLKEKDVRIILGNFNETLARRIFCEARKLGMYGGKYQWLLVTMYTPRWWKVEEPGLECSKEELLEALDGYIATDLLPLRTSNITTVSGLTAQQYKQQYDSHRNHTYSRFHGYAYDGIWTTALAIENVDKKVKEKRNDSISLKYFRYRSEYWGKVFLEALNETQFEGVTGPVKFFNNDRRGYIQIKQFQRGREVKIGEYDGILGILDLSKGETIRWEGGVPPADRTLITYEQTRVNLTIYAILAAIASFGILSAFSFLMINIRYRNQRFIKMSSPYLNNLIIIGCILTYTSVILLGLDSGLTSVEALPFVCTVRAWVLMSGFTLAFGSMFSKTWRVHAIFTNIKLNKKVIKDYQLYMVVGVLLAVDIAIMTTWQAIDPFYRETKNLAALIPHPNKDMQIIPVIEFCKSNRQNVFLGVIYAYKGLLMVFGCFLAWETRHVSIPALNDSKYIGMSVYNVVIMCVIGAAISFILSDQQNASFIIISVFIIFCTTTTICLVFVPKLIELKRNPQGADKRARATFKPSLKKRRDSEESDMQESIKTMQEENQRCRKTLRENDLELQSLLKQLGEDMHDVFGSDLRDRSKTPRRVEVLRREVAFVDMSGNVMEDEDMNSVCSTSSHDGDQAQALVEVPPPDIQRKRHSFSSNLPTIDASREDVNDSQRDSCSESHEQLPVSPEVDEEILPSERHYTARQSIGFDEAVPLIVLNRMNAEQSPPVTTATQGRYDSPVPLIDFKQLEHEAETEVSSLSKAPTLEMVNNNSERKTPTTSSRPSSDEMESPKGSGSDSNKSCSDAEPAPKDDVTQGGTGSLPNIAEGRRVLSPLSGRRRILAPKNLHFKGAPTGSKTQPDVSGRTEVQPTNHVSTSRDGASSYPTLKCDIVEYL